jgi:perosamine synthetase
MSDFKYPIFEPYFSGNEKQYVNKALNTGWISSQGEFIHKFEEQFANRFDKKYGVATSNCTTALHLSLVTLGVSSGDEVICPDLTFIAPANMVALTGAKVVLVDVEEDTLALKPSLVEQAITKKTKAIIVVHPFGHAARMDELQEIADHYKLPIIEDNAESIGATYKGKILGSLGKVSCFSFFANKIITTGEGGMVLTDDQELYFSLKELRDHGMSRDRKYFHVALGFNYRMTNMQAAIGVAQLEGLNNILKRRNLQEEIYENYLSSSDKLYIRSKESRTETVHWLMTVRFKMEGIREKMLVFLKNEGIDCRQMIYPVHYAQHFKEQYVKHNFPVSEIISLNSLHLPSSTNLSEESIEEISKAVLKGLKLYG